MESPASHFDRLGLPCRFDLEPAEVEERYLAQSRALHPDFHQEGTAAAQHASLVWTALLNEAYATLRDPFKRADYLLGLLGGPSAAEQRQMDPEFLEEMLEIRERVEEVRAGGPDSPGVLALESELRQRRERLIQTLSGLFSPLPEGQGGLSRRRQIRGVLNTARYIEGLLRDFGRIETMFKGD